MSEYKIPLIVIAGPTAAGKTALGVALGTEFSGEIISADSRQFYRFMNIGTAKPTPEEMSAVQHHLIDIALPDETVGLAQFLSLSRAAIQSITQAGNTPFLVGGTGQYIKALLQGWQVPEVPPDPELRAQLEARASADPDGLWQQLLAFDPEVVAFIDPRNIRRVIRALEVCLKSQRPYSELRRRTPPPYRVLQIGLTAERQFLYDRADRRVDQMMKHRLLEEVKFLLHMGYDWALPAMSGLGYIQFKPYFEEGSALEDIVERIQLDTHDFIRRQYNWFRLSNPDIHWLDIQDSARVEKARLLVSDFLSPQ
jgi:tRNA dimethylallyltransferase